MKLEELDPYIIQIRELNLVSLAEVSSKNIQPIIDKLIDNLYKKREGGSSLTAKKHIISQSLLKNFAPNRKNPKVNVNGYLGLKKTDGWMFCLPQEKQDFWTQDIEIFCNFIEDHGAKALTHFQNQMDGDPADLVTDHVNPLASIEEIRMRLLLALYLAMHIERQVVSKIDQPLCDQRFLNEMKLLTADLFFCIWTWCKVSKPTFVVPLNSIVKINFSSSFEYILPISPTLALLVAAKLFPSFIPLEYAFDDKRNTDSSYERAAEESALLGSSEQSGQQKFMIQNGPTSYKMYHSNSRLGTIDSREYSFSHEIFLRLTGKVKEVYPTYISAVTGINVNPN